MRRRRALASLAAATLVPAAARGQEAGRTYRLGAVITVPRTDASISTVLAELNRQGFVEGRNLVVDPRGMDLRADQMEAAAREVAAAGPDLILTGGAAATRAAQAATRTIPILAITDDMVAEGLVGSLANRSGNTTGISILAPELDGKRQELLIQLLPDAKKLAMLATAPGERLVALQARAHGDGVDVAAVLAAKPDEIEPALRHAREGGATGLNILANSFLFAMRHRIFETATALGLATMYQWPETIREGALAAYGPSLDEMFRQRGRQAAKLLRGAQASDMPIEQPTTVRLAINQKLAGRLGIAVPPTLLLRADEVVE